MLHLLLILLVHNSYIYLYISSIKAYYLILLVFDFSTLIALHRFEMNQFKRNLYANIRLSDRRYSIKIFDGTDFGFLDSRIKISK